MADFKLSLAGLSLFLQEPCSPPVCMESRGHEARTVSGHSSSFFLDDILIPVCAKLPATGPTFRGTLVEENFPRSLENLKSSPNFTNVIYGLIQFGRKCDFPDQTGNTLIHGGADSESVKDKTPDCWDHW